MSVWDFPLAESWHYTYRLARRDGYRRRLALRWWWREVRPQLWGRGR